MLRDLGLWQDEYCHNPKFVDTYRTEIATTLDLATCRERGASWQIRELPGVAAPDVDGEKNLDPLSCAPRPAAPYARVTSDSYNVTPTTRKGRT